MKIEFDKSWETAIAGYADELKDLLRGYTDADLLELGAGRWPAFRLAEMPSNVRSYTVNDISDEELNRLPEGYQKALFDVCGDASPFSGRYDVVFSRFLLEHLPDGRLLHKNVYQILKPGGVAFHFTPTLFAIPFLVNKILPEVLTSHLLRVFAPSRTISPKFPAYYSVCRGNTRWMRKLLTDIGYRKVEIRSFYGHFYYDNVPVLKDLQRMFAAFAARADWSWISSYAYIKVYK